MSKSMSPSKKSSTRKKAKKPVPAKGTYRGDLPPRRFRIKGVVR